MLPQEMSSCILVFIASVALTGVHTSDTPRLASGARNMRRLNTGLQSKITPVNDAKENEYPFVVYLVNAQENHKCSGSLIERRWVLTAAHCLLVGSTHVVLGDYDRSTNATSSKQMIAIAEEIRHPEYVYSSNLINNDIGLVRLARPANIRSEAISKVAMLKSKSLKAKFLANEKLCKVLGWGLQLDNMVWSSATRLQQLKIRFVNDSETLQNDYKVYPTVLSTEAIYEDECRVGSICNGDSGGPVVCRKGGSWIVVSLTSIWWINTGCIYGISGTTDVQQLVPWVESVINE